MQRRNSSGKHQNKLRVQIARCFLDNRDVNQKVSILLLNKTIKTNTFNSPPIILNV